MPAVIHPGVRSFVLSVDRPYEDDGVTPRDDFIGMKVWVSADPEDVPVVGEVQVADPAYDGPGTNCTISGLTPGVTYSVWYALISSVDPEYLVLSPRIEVSPITEVAGESAASYWLMHEPSVIIQNPDGTLSPDAVTASARYKVGSGTAAPYRGRFLVEASNGGPLSQVYLSSGDETACVADLPNGTTEVRVSLLAEGGGVVLDTSTVPVVPAPVTYDVKIESTNGTEFRVGQGTTTLLIARVFRNGVEVTNSIDASKFQWTRVSLNELPPPQDDSTWNSQYASGYKQVQVNIDSVHSRATFHCKINA